ncbi:aspartate/glutamate racemase family protein [Marinovum sp.]|uniref:aspartate/glutamate racemase family protein n=1 Tax=Marinovum sp. TaxID=2024839 RepID=UPI002B26979D|nr:aspartate/glutamate racemase family protein [Marinovum sp.]
MRLMLLNPNTTTALTERLVASARSILPDEVTLVPVTAERGFPYISSRPEAQLAGAEVLEIVAAHLPAVDAVTIAAFGDPGLDAAREAFDLPITGMTEAAMVTALQLGQTFAFVTFTPQIAPWYRDQVTRAQLSARFAGVFSPRQGFGDITSVAEDLTDALRETCKVAARHADVLVLAGAPIAGLASVIEKDVPAVLIDPVKAAVLQAHALWRLRPKGADKGGYARPPGKASVGLSSHLSGWLQRETTRD